MSSLHGHGVLADITGVQLTVNAGHTRVTKFLPHNIFLDNANHDCHPDNASDIHVTHLFLGFRIIVSLSTTDALDTSLRAFSTSPNSRRS